MGKYAHRVLKKFPFIRYSYVHTTVDRWNLEKITIIGILVTFVYTFIYTSALVVFFVGGGGKPNFF